MIKPKKFKKQKGVSLAKIKKKKKKDKFCGLKQDVVLLHNNKKVDVPSIENNLKKKKKKAKLYDVDSEEMSSLSLQKMRSPNDISKTENKRLRMKRKIEDVKVSEISKENLLKSKHKLKKKKQNLDRLSDILQKSNNHVKNPVSSLKQFLQGL